MRKVKVAAEKAEETPTLMGGELDLAVAIAEQSDEIKRLITSGELIATRGVVNRTVEKKPFQKHYLKLQPTTMPACLALVGGVETTWKTSTDKDGNDTSDFDGACLVKDFYYGNDLGVKNRESGKLAVLVEGPDKAKQSAAKQLAKAWNISEEEALRRIKAMEG